MTALAAALQFIVDASLVLIGISAIHSWWVRRNRGQGLLALAIGLLGATAALGVLSAALSYRYPVISDLSLVLFLGSGWALLRFRDAVIPLAPRVRRALGGLVAAAGFLALLARLPSGPDAHYSGFQFLVLVVAILAWCSCVGEPAVRLYLAATELPSVQRARLRALSAGYAACIIVLALSVVAAGAGTSGNTTVRLGLQLLSLLVVPFLWAGFAPPQILRRYWRRSEEAQLRQGLEQLLLFSPDRVTLAERALGWGLRLSGAQMGVIADAEGRVLARDGLDEGQAAQLLERVGSVTTQCMVQLEASADRPVRRLDRLLTTAYTAIVLPLPSVSGMGLMVVVAGSLTPIFGVDEQQRLDAYATALSMAMERVRLTEVVHRTEQEFRSAFDDAPIGVAIVNLEGRFVRVNRALCEIVGYDEGQLLTREFRALTHPDDLQRDEAEMARLLNGTETSYRVEKRYLHADGSVLWVLVAVSLVRDRDGAPLHFIGQVENISAQREAQRVAEQARAEADAASRAKSEFLSRVSHELRTPLNAVLGFAELLEMGEDLDTTQSDYVRTILRAGNHLLDLINDVLDISRIEEGRLSLSLEPIAVGALVAEVVDLVRPLAANRNVTMERGPVPPELHLAGDHQRCKQVLLNLLSNAIKYNHRGGTVSVTTTTAADPCRVRIAVRDTGPGITRQDITRLFSPFERLDAARTGVEGTGLGLALSKGLAEGMGGSLAVESQVGEGTTFILVLPLAEAPTAAGGVDEPPLIPAAAGEARSTVLYIEDTASNVRLMEGIVTRRPAVHLISAPQGGLGLELARQHRPDLVLLDLHLPDMDGRAVLVELRSDPRTAGVPVVVVSADATRRQIERLLDEGAQDYITKPLTVRRVLEVLDTLLGVEAQGRRQPAFTGADGASAGDAGPADEGGARG